MLGFQRLNIPGSKPATNAVIEKTEDRDNIWVSDEDMPASDEGGAGITIPSEYRKYSFCKKWKGNSLETDKTPRGVYGICSIYNGRGQLSTGGENCERFEPNWGRMAKIALNGYD